MLAWQNQGSQKVKEEPFLTGLFGKTAVRKTKKKVYRAENRDQGQGQVRSGQNRPGQTRSSKVSAPSSHS